VRRAESDMMKRAPMHLKDDYTTVAVGLYFRETFPSTLRLRDRADVDFTARLPLDDGTLYAVHRRVLNPRAKRTPLTQPVTFRVDRVGRHAAEISSYFSGLVSEGLDLNELLSC
jgi:hypothetical protein